MFRLWLPESKLRPFCKENDRLFLENSPLLSTKYRKELEKAYKKAKKYSKNYMGQNSEPESPAAEQKCKSRTTSTQNLTE